jgi:hypothetical protein
LVRPVITQEVAMIAVDTSGDVVQDCVAPDALVATAVYDRIVEPLAAAANQATAIDPSPAAAVTAVGAPGTPTGVADTADDFKPRMYLPL